MTKIKTSRKNTRSKKDKKRLTEKFKRRANIKQENINVQNEAFEMIMQNAGTELSSLSKTEVSTFYRLTQNLWENKSVDYRNEFIMKGLGVDNLEEAYNLVMSQLEQDIPTDEEASDLGSPVARIRPLIFKK